MSQGGHPVAINREALHAFIDRQCDHVEATPIPAELEALSTGEKLTPAETLALWHAAGVASQIGMALALEPGAYVEGMPEMSEDEDEEAGHAKADALNEEAQA